MAITPTQILAGTPSIWPHPHVPPALCPSLPPIDINKPGAPPIEAIFMFYDPENWGVELQILTDVLAGGNPLGTGNSGQAVEVYACNPDFLWRAAYPASRYGNGAFVECLKALWRRKTGLELKITGEFGKPHKSQFDIAHDMIANLAGSPLDEVNRIYMVGDNPAADIRGANGAGDPWRSIMLCTGVYQGGLSSNCPVDPAWRVEADLRSAVETLLSQPENEHFLS
eukprot:TRINITY_DN30781_c0_g1_i1.p1 TRINITY_DN30781_c0_g1~~TRINITY_DN30781_c0_g1_i1.p1  ORF type:complete len:260 (+),score=45.42 TRINITY_DN30781_c0_g1_i1:103-780(+)